MVVSHIWRIFAEINNKMGGLNSVHDKSSCKKYSYSVLE